MAKKTTVRLMLGSLLLAMLATLTFPMYGQYGGHSVSLAIFRYMEKNDGRWPGSWTDIEPYHKDIILPMRSTAIVRRFWDVNWNADPQQLYRESKATSQPSTPRDHGVLPVVFNRKWYPKDGRVTRWILPPVIQSQLDKKEREQAPGEITDPLPR